MTSLPTDRSTSSTRQNHLDDHNELHRLHNDLDTQSQAYSQHRVAADFPDLGGTVFTAVAITAADKLVNRSNSTGSLNDAIGYDFWLPSGIYRLDLLCAKTANAGIVTPNVDGTDLATIDLYNSTTAFFSTSWTGITIAATGVKRVKFTMASKNASSTGYGLAIIQLAISRTGA